MRDTATLPPMKLRDYLHQNRLRANAFAKLVDASPASVGRWLKDEMPSSEKLRRIADATDGAVMPNDFMEGWK